MTYHCNLKGKQYQFQSVKEVLAKVSEVKSGDILVGIAAESTLEPVLIYRI